MTEQEVEEARRMVKSANGKLGGIARAAKLSPERRVEIAKIANRARNRVKKPKRKEDE